MKINSWLGIFQRLWGNLKVLFIVFYENFKKTASCEAKNHLAGQGKLLQGKTDRLVMNQKNDRFATATAIFTRANAYLEIKISRHTISWRLNEINWNSRVASMKPGVDKKNKMSQMKFVNEHVIWSEEQWGCVHFSGESKFNLFGCDGRMFVRRSPKEQYSPQCTKSCVKFGEGSVMVFGMLVDELLSGYIVKLTQLNTKRYWKTST